MDSHNRLFSLLSLFLLFLLLSGYNIGHLVLQAEARSLQNPTKLFVFGDSYADTGNIGRDGSKSWKTPYGVTFPGKPAGRFSDGRVLTDYIAKYLGVRSPVPYKFRKSMPEYLKYGMNFAYGGTGVFNTSSPSPNMTLQIDFLQDLINHKVYSSYDLSNSVALVSVAGNDYSFYLATNNGSTQGLASFISSVVNQTIKNVVRIQGLGVKKIAVSGLQPLGCLPETTASSSFQECNDTFNTFVTLHNTLLTQALSKLNQTTNGTPSIVVLDLYDSFMSVLNHPTTHNIQNELKPCCVGVSSEYSCGSVDDNNVKKYSVCDDPKSAFFWDLVHPTQAGWHAIYNQLRATTALQQLQY
ncbi:GDSL esterase/lipase [Senna tora]|uniref:GDSL esterase/lipase n=1 Tax=Senna tora TaxID=362788 RepID=A0A834SIM4_9FABA|nr:GDSL esterase/lipase [Senna tora]